MAGQRKTGTPKATRKTIPSSRAPHKQDTASPTDDRLFLPQDLLGIAGECQLQLLPEVDAPRLSLLALTLDEQVHLASARFAKNIRGLKPDDRRRKQSAIQRKSEELLARLGLPQELSPVEAESATIPLEVQALLRPGTDSIPMPRIRALITAASGVGRLLEKSEPSNQEAKPIGQALDQNLAEAALTLLPVILATLRAAAKNAVCASAEQPSSRDRHGAAQARHLLVSLAQAHRSLFGKLPSLRGSLSEKDTRSLRWVKRVLEVTARRLATDQRWKGTAEFEILLGAANRSMATMSNMLQAELARLSRGASANTGYG